MLPVAGESCLALASRLGATDSAFAAGEGAHPGWREVLLGLAHEALLALDVSGRVRFASAGCERLFGRPAASIVGRRLAEEAGWGGEELARGLRQARETGHWGGELAFHSAGGHRLVLHARCALAWAEGERLPGLVLALTDISSQKKLQAQLWRLQREENAGRLASGMAHDLNNTLAPIIVAADLLSLREWGKEDREYIEMIKSSALRGTDLVKQLLLYCRGSDGASVLLDLAKLARETARFTRGTFPKSIQVKLDLAPGLWPVMGDATQFQQILLNLLINGRDAMPQGGLLGVGLANMKWDAVSPAAQPKLEPGDYVRLRVWDSGVGMAPETLAKIFDPYFTTKPAGQGTGLGLTTVHAIVRSWGGWIEVESQPGVGTQFLAWLPARKLASARPAILVDTAEYLGNGELILVVDDEDLVRLAAKRVLELHGYRVALAKHGMEALSQYKKRVGTIRAVLLDIWMPFLDGLGVVGELQQLDPRAKIIATSGLLDHEQKMLKASPLVKAFLPKPWQKSQMLKTLRDVLRG